MTLENRVPVKNVDRQEIGHQEGRDLYSLLEAVLGELKVANFHLQQLTDIEVDRDDLNDRD